MARETRSKGVKITVEVAPSLRTAFNKQSKKMNLSVSQRLRDWMQAELKFNRKQK